MNSVAASRGASLVSESTFSLVFSTPPPMALRDVASRVAWGTAESRADSQDLNSRGMADSGSSMLSKMRRSGCGGEEEEEAEEAAFPPCRA
jgi:hypothetical protein